MDVVLGYNKEFVRGARQLTGDEERGGVKSKQIRIAPKFIV